MLQTTTLALNSIMWLKQVSFLEQYTLLVFLMKILGLDLQ